MQASEMNWAGLTDVIHFGIDPDSASPHWMVDSQDSLDLLHGGGWVWPNNSWNIPESLVTVGHANGVSIILSIGGIYGSGKSAMDYITEDSVRTQTFVDRVIDFAETWGYDGIEVDWEPPANLTQNMLLLRILKRAMDLSASVNKLIIAGANDYEDYWDASWVNANVDQFNIMLYDMNWPGSGYCQACSLDVTGYNAPIYRTDPEVYPVLADYNYNYNGDTPARGDTPSSGPRKFIESGYNSSVLGLGIPFYGYVYNGKTAPNQLRGASYPQYISYPLILDAIDAGLVVNRDTTAKTVWCGGTVSDDISWYLSTSDDGYITYDDSTSIVEKIDFLNSLNMGGVMIYELWQGWFDAGTSPRDPLLRAVVAAMESEPSSPIPYRVLKRQ